MKISNMIDLKKLRRMSIVSNQRELLDLSILVQSFYWFTFISDLRKLQVIKICNLSIIFRLNHTKRNLVLYFFVC